MVAVGATSKRTCRPSLLRAGRNVCAKFHQLTAVRLTKKVVPLAVCNQINPNETPRFLRSKQPGDSVRIAHALNRRNVRGKTISVELHTRVPRAFLGELDT